MKIQGITVKNVSLCGIGSIPSLENFNEAEVQNIICNLSLDIAPFMDNSGIHIKISVSDIYFKFDYLILFYDSNTIDISNYSIETNIRFLAGEENKRQLDGMNNIYNYISGLSVIIDFKDKLINVSSTNY